jgi:hypothetical protein
MIAWLRRIFAVGARAYHRHHVEVMPEEHTKPGEPNYEEDHAYYEKFGGLSLGLASWVQDKVSNLDARSTAAERVFAVMKYFSDRAPCMTDEHLVSIVQFHVNETGRFWAKRFAAMRIEEIDEFTREINRIVRERNAREGNGRAQQLKKGLAQKVLDDVILEKAAEAREAKVAELQRLTDLKRDWASFESMSGPALADQIKACNWVDKADLRTGKLTTKLARLRVLVQHYKLKVVLDVIVNASKKVATGDNRRAPAGKAGGKKASGCGEAAERVEVAVVGAVATRATAAAEREVRLRVFDLEWQEQE